MFPSSELEWWSCCFSIDDNQNRPIQKQEDITIDESKKGFKDIWK